jgi:ribosomal protein S28E/S33
MILNSKSASTNTNKKSKVYSYLLGFLIICFLLISVISITVGESSSGTDYSFVMSSRENAPPHVNITQPTDEETVSGVINITGHAWDTDGNITKVRVRIYEVWYNATDASGNNSWYNWFLLYNTTILSDGEYRVVALSYDNNESLADFGIWIIVKNNVTPENQKPTIWIEAPANNSEVSGEIVIKGHAKDDKKVNLVDLVIAEKEYMATDKSGNETWWSWKLVFNTTILKNGEYWVTAWAWDAEENLGGSDKILIIVNNTIPENQAPYVEIMLPMNEATVSGTIKIKGRAGDPDGNVTTVKIRIFEVWYNATDTSGNGSWYTWSLDFDTTKLKDGEYKVTAAAWDNKEKAADDAIWIIIKNTKENHWPYVNITQPKNEATVKGEILISGHAWDIDGNITNVRVKIGDVWYNATDDSGNGSWYKWSLKYNTTKLEDGEHKVVALSYDDGGKLGDEGIWIIVKNKPTPKENMAPHIVITQPKNEATVSGVITIKGKAWDSDGNISIVKLRIYEVWYNATDKSGNGTWYNWEFQFNTTKLKDGEYRVTGISYDNKEKAEDTHIWIIVKNKVEEPKNQAPFINISQPSMEQNVSGLVTIKGYAMDPDGNITSVQVRIGENLFNATDTSGNDSWYTWEIIWNTSGYEDGWFRVSALASDGTLKEDSHVEIKVNNSASSKGDQNENDDQKKKPPKSSIPGFEMPFLIAAAVAAVVVSFFRSGGRNRTKQI